MRHCIESVGPVSFGSFCSSNYIATFLESQIFNFFFDLTVVTNVLQSRGVRRNVSLCSRILLDGGH